MSGGHKVVRLADDPAVEEPAHALVDVSWPPFMLGSPVARDLWGPLLERFPRQQAAVREGPGGPVVAWANAVPVAMDPTSAGLPDEGWDAALRAGVEGGAAGVAPTALCALQVVVHPDRRSRGLAALLLREMHVMARELGLRHLVAPVRPTGKADEPLLPMDAYAARTGRGGAPLDPWLRAHWRLGARIVKVAPRSMTIPAPVVVWHRWTGLALDRDGPHLVPGALVPVEVDLAAGTACYVEPNVWMHHRVRAT